ncbi:MAG: O-antigen ligase family protein [Tannerella sp.]|nr:O-antigen ligase family protein [Tannerella sp.]
MVRQIIHGYFFYFFVFVLFFEVLLGDMTGFGSLGVVSDTALFAAYLLFLFTAGERKISMGIVVTLLVFLFYLAYSFFVACNNIHAIALDFLMQSRPYLTFFIVMQMANSFTGSRKLLLKRLSLSIWTLFIPLGIYGAINPVAFAGTVIQPAGYTSSIVILSLLYLYCCGFSLRERLMFLLMLSAGLIVVHARFYEFFILACAVLIFLYRRDSLLSGLRTGIALAMVLGMTAYISESQITDYLSTRAVAETDHGFAARAVLYQTAEVLLKDFFPLGSGLASFASHASRTYYSPIYSNYGLSSVNGLTPQEWFSASDSYCPSLAQFGIVGIALYLFFWTYIVWLAFSKLRKKGEIQPFIVALVLTSFAFIENIFDSFFTNNRGVFMMMFLGVIFSKPGAVAAVRKKAGHAAPREIIRLTTLETVPDANDGDRKKAENDGEAYEDENVAETPTSPPYPTPESVHESAPDCPTPPAENTEEETDEEYGDFEEYCEDDADFDATGGTVPEEEKTDTPEDASDEDAPTDKDKECPRTNDPHTGASRLTPPSALPTQSPHHEKSMEQEFRETLEKLKTLAEEKRRLLREKESDESDAAHDGARKEDGAEPFSYII